jgi:hypothetical protein
MTLERGLYETLITEELVGKLDGLAKGLKAKCEPLRPGEAGDRVALHVAKVFERALAMVGDVERAHTAVELARRLIDQVNIVIAKGEVGRERPITASHVVLTQIVGHLPDRCWSPP